MNTQFTFNKLPSMFSVYFDTKWQNKADWMIFILRVCTQLFSKSRYEHVANVIKCPEQYHGVVYNDNTGALMVKAGEYYVFEATKHSGFIITPLKTRLISISKDWTGNIDMQAPINAVSKESQESAWVDATSMLGVPYAVASAFFSAFDQISFFRKIRKRLGYKTKLTKGVFCSMFAIINWSKAFNLKIVKEQAYDFTPEEVLNFLLEKKVCGLPLPLLKFQNGNIIGMNILK